LISSFIKLLAKIAVTIKQADADHRHTEVCGGPEHIARQYAQSSCVCWDCRIDSYLHRKIGDFNDFLIQAFVSAW
jgi:hypothetical protein